MIYSDINISIFENNYPFNAEVCIYIDMNMEKIVMFTSKY